MSDSSTIDTVARRSAARLADIDSSLPDQVEQALAADPLATPSERIFDPISLGALIVSIASLGWTIYHDTKKDRAAAGLDRAAKIQHLKAQLQDEGADTARRPPELTPQQHARIVDEVSTQIVDSDISG